MEINIGEIIETRTPFFFLGTTWSTMDQKMSKNGLFPGHIVFLHSPWDLPTFSAERSISKRLKMPFWARGSNPKVLIMRWIRS